MPCNLWHLCHMFAPCRLSDLLPASFKYVSADRQLIVDRVQPLAGKSEPEAAAQKPAPPASSRPPPQAFRPPPQPRGPNALSALDKARRTHNESIRADGKVHIFESRVFC